jgi:hypothetical protein
MVPSPTERPEGAIGMADGPEDTGRRAADRAAAAGRRARELSDRLARLAAGQQPDVDSVREARAQAEAAAERARESLEHARAGHVRAARAHQRTAELHESAARDGVGDAEEHRGRAAGHRLAAAEDERAAEDDRRAAEGRQAAAVDRRAAEGSPGEDPPAGVEQEERSDERR